MSKDTNFSYIKQRARYILGDWITANVAFFVFNIVRYYILWEFTIIYGGIDRYLFSTKLIIEQIFVPIAMLFVYWLSGYYNKPFGKSRLQELSTTFFSTLLNTALIYLILLINDQTGQRRVNYEILSVLFGIFFLFTYIVRIFITQYSLVHFRKHHWRFRILVIGNSTHAHKAIKRLINDNNRVSYEVMGFVELPGEESSGSENIVIPFDDLEKACQEHNIDQLILAPENYNEEKVLKILYRLFPLNLPIKISPDTFSFVTSAIRLKDIYGEPFVDLTSPTLTESSKNIKRIADVVISLLVLIILSPLFLVVALLIKKNSKGPVFYSQERIGLRQKPFMIYKFRTMYTDAEKFGPQLSSDNDARITTIGKTLRKYRLDEFPQFWNVLKGDMSIVGPRPERDFFIQQIVQRAPYYTLVYQVRPGITSWGMVKYGYASTVDQMVERTRYDLIYLANMSLYVDIKILIYTIKTVVTGKGV